MSTNMKEIEFQTASYEQWEEQAIKALKGKPFESLFTKTIEGVTLEPLYTQEMLVEKLGDQLEKQVATIRALSATNGVQIAQQITGDSPDQFFSNLDESLSRGNNIITIDSRLPFTVDGQFTAKLSDYLTEYSFKLMVENENDPLLKVFNGIEENKRDSVEGFIISKGAVNLKGYSKVRTLGANTIPYHNDGANAVQELALALALAAKQLKTADSYEAFASKFFVNFAIDTQFFAEIAKLRAFKVLWKAFAAGVGVQAIAVPIVAETSVRSFSKVDVYVNLLRAGNEAFAGAIGGADVLTVHPHDVLTKPTATSTRIAQNALLVINEESHVLNVLDPAGGSYFIESLTADYVKAAWALFLEIEEAGGIEAYKETISTQIEEVYKQRITEVETRKHSLIGTNIYANPVDELPIEENPQFSDVKRLAIPFENLRKEFAAANAKIAMLTFGELKNFKPRADFVAGFFNTAGISPEQSGALDTIDAAKAWLAQADADYVCIVATDDDTKELVPALLADKPSHIVLDAAGKFKEEADAWLSKGLNGFIFAGQNIIEKLRAVTASMKEVQR
ncbi:methylmalonyl-CoA mutase family protein [Lysinibacillus odysseyi]|uniref:Methylmalonyl-CoA mutase n=2 Tax=Lysinibacillus odysseyi TaxID=202611 RepID=A0A0A3IA71_9BACI|nr:methylmalonyl-CoA mutase family protein [Lysinibacillus odysseyi]KGR81639.1 methylmalonyl-CoA mutase [Lysinibacillus odysseyi 34hs-1 = NBRC 100172]